MKLLIGYISQFSSLPVPIRNGRYNSKGREDRGKMVEVAEFEHNGVKTSNGLSDAAHLPHNHFLHTHKHTACVLVFVYWRCECMLVRPGDKS